MGSIGIGDLGRILIILDTCILRGKAQDSSDMDLLRTISKSGTERVAVPWVVLEERVAQHAIEHMELHQRATSALQALERKTHWKPVVQLQVHDPEGVRDYWRKEYCSFLDVISTSESVLREAVFREANLLKPARLDKKTKTGARDAAAWLSAIEYAREHPEEKVYFVSSNTGDFGDGTSYESPMREDLEGLEGRFIHLTSLNQVLTQFTKKVETKEEWLSKAFAHEATRRLLQAQLSTRDGGRAFNDGFEVTAFRGSLGSGPYSAWATRWIAAPVATFESLSGFEAYEIGEKKWYTASVRWLLSGLAFVDRDGRPTFAPVSCWWDTRVLASTGPQLVVVRGGRPERLTPGDLESFQDKAPNMDAVVRPIEEEGDLEALIAQIEIPGQHSTFLEELRGRLLASSEAKARQEAQGQ
ncbi:hypothetical protein CLM83_10560 [Streptomyces albidoflavus]|nr:hypothetical protein CLM83_10560 [Streptomyces albidoflavus]